MAQDEKKFLFEKEIDRIIDGFTDYQPFFLLSWYTPHIVLAPRQIPKEYLTSYDNDGYLCPELDHMFTLDIVIQMEIMLHINVDQLVNQWLLY